MNTETTTVMALRQHLNDHGEHQLGDEYVVERRHGEILIARGLVAAVDDVVTPNAAPENKRRAKAPATKN